MQGRRRRRCGSAKPLWKRYAVARELFHTRRTVAKALGLKWGAYHLGRPGDPIEQANNFIDFAEPAPDDLIALDIEENDAEKWMSLEDAETSFATSIQGSAAGRCSTPMAARRCISPRTATATSCWRVCQLWYAPLQADDRPAFPERHW